MSKPGADRPRLSNQTVSGAFFMAVGAFAFVKATDYRLGSATQMGPGYFPACLGILLMVLGLLCVVRGLTGHGAPVGAWRAGPPALVIASVAFFALTVDRLGLMPAVAGVVAISCLPRLRQRPVEALVIAGGLCLLTAFVFVELLGLPFKLF